MVCICIPGAPMQRALNLVFCRRPVSLMRKHQSEGGMSLAGCRIDLNGLERCRFRSGESFRRRREAVPGKSAVTVGQTRVGNPIVVLLIYGLLEIIRSFLNSLCCSLVPKITAFEISLI